MSECNHIIGTAVQDYQDTLVRADDSPDDFHFNSFNGHRFCGECGEDVTELAAAFSIKMDERYEKFWEGYQKQHGEDEYQRARFRRGPLWERQKAEEARKSIEIQARWNAEKEARNKPPRFSSFLEKGITPEGESYQWPTKS